MWPRNSKLKLPWITGALLILVLLAGCAEVEVVDKTPAASAPEQLPEPMPVGVGKHNLAVMAVDFDPPLSYKHLMVRREAVALLVVVENTGTETEQDVDEERPPDDEESEHQPVHQAGDLVEPPSVLRGQLRQS